MPLIRRTLLMAASLPLATLTACSKRFEVVIANQRDVKVMIGVGQFRAPDFTANPPKTFTEHEMVRSEVIELKPGERRTLVYDTASGGFWLQWRMLDPLPEPNSLNRIDLLHDERRIVIAQVRGGD